MRRRLMAHIVWIAVFMAAVIGWQVVLRWPG